MLVWKDEYAVGIELIDEQHKKLFEIGNSIYTLLADQVLVDKYDRVITIINELKQYTKYHFACEEEYMMKIRYPKFLSHKVEHDDFISKVEEVEFEDIDQDQDKYIRDIMTFVFNWILDHILKNDKLITASSK